MLKPLADGRFMEDTTGEIKIQTVTIHSTDEVVSVKKKPEYGYKAQEPTIPWQSKSKFVKLYTDSLREVIEVLTNTEVMVSMYMVSYIDYYSNMLKRADGLPVSNKDIAVDSGFSEKHITDIMKSLVSKRIFARTEVGRGYQYFANPYIFTKGNRINATLYAMFKNYRKQGNEKAKKNPVEIEGKQALNKH